MNAHTSNYAVQGFTAAVDDSEIAGIAHAHELPVASDQGRGALVDLAAYGLPHDPTPNEKPVAGCDVVTISGDKVLGGPQEGTTVGRREAIERIRKLPMKRALRMSKLSLAALAATLRFYLGPERLACDLPTLRLLTRPFEAIRALALALQPLLAGAVLGQIGSGSLPVDCLASVGLVIAPAGSAREGAGAALDRLVTALRGLPLTVIDRVSEDRLLLDLRCLEDDATFGGQLQVLKAALA